MRNTFKRIAGNLDNTQDLCCADPEVKEILNLETGEIISAREAIGYDVNRAMTLRRRLRSQLHDANENQMIMICPYCHKPLSLKCQFNGQRFYFAHIHRDNNCPQLDRKNWSKERIQAAKYNGQKESIPHKLMKEQLFKILEADPRFSDISVEKVVRGEDPSTWRKPDVRALYGGSLRVVFEIQLSTTFLDVVLGRRDFYSKKGELLVWIFKQFSTQDARMMEFDTFHANNMNAIVLDKEAWQQSRSRGRLSLKCVWVEPRTNETNLSHIENCGIFDFAELHKSVEHQKIFHFDYDSHRALVDEGIKKRQESIASEEVRNKFFESFDPMLDADDLCKYANKFFPNLNLCNNRIKWRLRGYFRMMNAAKTGNPRHEGSGWNYKNFKNIYDNVFKSHTSLFFIFCCAMKTYSRTESSSSIETRKKEAWNSIRTDGVKSKFHHDPVYTELTKVLFPEVHTTYNDLLEKYNIPC